MLLKPMFHVERDCQVSVERWNSATFVLVIRKIDQIVGTQIGKEAAQSIALLLNTDIVERPEEGGYRNPTEQLSFLRVNGYVL